MQTSVAPVSQASRALRTTSSAEREYASAAPGPLPNPQKLQPTKQTLVKLMLRFTTSVIASPTVSRRNVSAKEISACKSAASVLASSKPCSNVSSWPARLASKHSSTAGEQEDSEACNFVSSGSERIGGIHTCG